MKKVDHDARRQEVAAAAAYIIATQGLEALTTRALAKELGCSIGVLSHYFDNKDDIVEAAFNWADQRIDSRFEEAWGGTEFTLDNFIPVISAGLPLDEESDLEWRVRLNLFTYAMSSPQHMSVQLAKRKQLHELLSTLIGDLQAQGQVRDDIDAGKITDLAVDLVRGTAFNMLLSPMEERRAQASYLVTLVEKLRPGSSIEPIAKELPPLAKLATASNRH